MAAAGCIFCAIIDGLAPSHRVLEDATCVAFLDARPLFPGHVLVVPRIHRDTLADLKSEEVAGLFSVAQSVSRALEVALGAEGTFVAMNNRVSQSVPHAHVHVVPRRKGDGLRGFFWPRQKYASSEEAAAMASTLREAIEPRTP
ncbi:MAG TPA: HIT family protein [Polyangiaceae bacterium]|jgi:histidine triad (HIT) family protein